jgi:hypothetical protein
MDGSFKCSSSAIFSVMHATRPYSTVHSRYAASQIETGCGLRRQRILAAQVFLAYGARLAGARDLQSFNSPDPRDNSELLCAALRCADFLCPSSAWKV